MSISKMVKKDGRLSFAHIPDMMGMPYLLETQKHSYAEFLQFDAAAEKRENKGLQEVFNTVFPIICHGNLSTLEFVEYNFGRPKYDVEECLERGMTYAAPLRVKLQLIVREINEETGEVEIRDIKEQDTYFGEIPLMTENHTFIINGAERVVVSQLHRSPGITFGSTVHPNGKTTYSARLIPYRGAWLEFEIDINNVMTVLVDRKRKMTVTTFLRALGYQADEQIIKEFYNTEKIKLDDFSRGKTKVADLESYLGEHFIENVVDAKTKETVVKKGAKVTKKVIDTLQELKIKAVELTTAAAYQNILGLILATDVVDTKTGEILAECWEPITTTLLRRCAEAGINKVEVIKCEEIESEIIFTTRRKDKARTYEDALIEFFKKLRPGNPVSFTAARRLVDDMFFNERRYDLGAVGRYKINKKLHRPITDKPRTLLREDVLDLTKHLIRLQREQLEVDDIDHLGNRRIRTVGELLQNQIRIALSEMERTARERMSVVDLDNMLPQNLINAKPIISVVRDFFGRSQLSQFMDQVNPLAEMTHKRRLSALGPGGLSRERAGFEVRDVHHTHYGRICPVETPEGPNIGLITSLATYARINEYGFIESPFRVVRNGRVTEDIVYLTADVEDNYKIAQANAPVDGKGNFSSDSILTRFRGDFPRVGPKEIQYMDVSPKQMVSVSTSLIPFLEHDDANRALMGSNMQRQAVPLLFTEEPIVGTGMEAKVARDSGTCVLAKRDGEVTLSVADKIVVRTQDNKDDIYHLKKFRRSNQNTCVNQKPIVKAGDRVKAGQIVADGFATKHGELSLGKNVLVAFMSWGGYNFEDAIIISEQLVKDDIYTSIHIEEFEVEARDTKLGREEITRDIPNVREEALYKLDETGIIREGLEVKPGDILVGKVTPKGETELTSEEKLLRAIFGEKASDVKDTSLRVPPGISGTVIDIKIFSRKERDPRLEREDKARIAAIQEEKEQKLTDLWAQFDQKLKEILTSQLTNRITDYETGDTVLEPGQRITQKALDYIKQCLNTGMLPVDGKAAPLVKTLYQEVIKKKQEIDDIAANKIDRIKTGDELAPGVNKLIKVYVATKRKLSEGDKIAGRHGNKGVVARIVPAEDMPFLADGTPIQIILNPMGVPSRMNVGQIFETHLGWIGKLLGLKFSSPVFDGVSEQQIRELLKEASLPETGQAVLYDGHTGLAFDTPVTVGYIYIMKLIHMVDDKMHSRAIGPYSIVTQQPLGGKAQFGGQRFGEMEVWALEAYGAAYSLQEMLTVKSDDVVGRSKIYESIVKGRNTLSPGIPESFNVLVKELQSLGLNFELLTEMEEEPEKEAEEAEADLISEGEEELLLGEEDEEELVSEEEEI